MIDRHNFSEQSSSGHAHRAQEGSGKFWVRKANISQMETLVSNLNFRRLAPP